MMKNNRFFTIIGLVLAIIIIAGCARQPTVTQDDLKEKYAKTAELLKQKQAEGYDISVLREDLERAKQLAVEGKLLQSNSLFEQVRRRAEALTTTTPPPSSCVSCAAPPAGCSYVGGTCQSCGTLSCTTEPPETEPEPDSTAEIRVISSSPCGNAICHTLGVSCLGLKERQVKVREFEAENPKGTIILTTGGYGISLYGNPSSTNQQETINKVHDAGFETFEIAWSGQKGWAEGIFGTGYKNAMCGTAEVYKWISNNKADNPDVICAQGNSGGSFQIAYSLSVYGLEDLFDMVILTGGPPASRWDVGCFGTEDESLKDAVWPDGLYGFILTDEIMGWENNGDYCKNRAGPDWTVQKLRDISLVSTESRDFSFPKTKVNFVESEADFTAADEQGRIYYNKINTPKAWYDIAGTEHEVPNTKEGAEKIRELFLSECKKQ